MQENTIKLIRSKRKTLSLEINAKGDVLVRAPLRLSKREILAFVNEKSEWIKKHRKRLKIESCKKENIEVLTEEELEKLRQDAKFLFESKVKFFAAKMQVSYGRIQIRKQKSRWGSCSQAGNLNFNLLLLLAPEEVIDYVVVHELCHRKEMNHSKKFWELVEDVFPNYKECRSWLRENGGYLMQRGNISG